MGRNLTVLKPIYKHYILLIEISFWVLFVWHLRAAMLALGVPPELLLANIKPLHKTLWFMVTVVQFSVIPLILMGRLRDEYAERLWRQAAGTYVKFIIIMPLLWIAVILVFTRWENGMAWYSEHTEALLLPLGARVPNPTGSIGIYQFEVLNFLAAKLFAFLPLMFTGFFIWHRRRDRGGGAQ